MSSLNQKSSSQSSQHGASSRPSNPSKALLKSIKALKINKNEDIRVLSDSSSDLYKQK